MLVYAVDVVKWFADRADMIIIMFDAHKLDISDELKVRVLVWFMREQRGWD